MIIARESRHFVVHGALVTLLCDVAAAVEPLSASVIIYGHGKLFTRICWRPQHSDTVDINALH